MVPLSFTGPRNCKDVWDIFLRSFAERTKVVRGSDISTRSPGEKKGTLNCTKPSLFSLKLLSQACLITAAGEETRAIML